MIIKLEVEVTRRLGRAVTADKVAEAYLAKILTRGGLEVENSAYEIMSVTVK